VEGPQFFRLLNKKTQILVFGPIQMAQKNLQTQIKGLQGTWLGSIVFIGLLFKASIWDVSECIKWPPTSNISLLRQFIKLAILNSNW